MLYLTTKDKNDIQTAYKALHNDVSANGGSYVPFHLPLFSNEDICKLKDKSFGQIVADMINLFFSTNLTGWDVDFALGRNLFKIKSLPGKTYVAELWHNAGGRYSYLAETLYRKVSGSDFTKKPTQWFCVAVRIAVIFALYASYNADKEIGSEQRVDVCVQATDDLTVSAAVFYARKMGLPVNNVICVCNENSAVWEFLYRGICQRKAAFPAAFECLVHAVLGYDGLQEFMRCKSGEGTSVLPEALLHELRDNMFISAVGQHRIDTVIAGAYRTNNYVFTTNSAMAFGGLQDYRASTGESRAAIIMKDSSPMDEQEHITSVLGISKKELSDLI